LPVLAVILSAAKDPEGLHPFTAFQLFPTRLSTVAVSLQFTQKIISTEAACAFKQPAKENRGVINHRSQASGRLRLPAK
jgi:hypothetical protein